MKEKLANLLTIKSLVTIILTLVFAVLALKGIFSPQEFLTIFTVVIAFYFGTQFAKTESEVKAAESDAQDVEDEPTI